MDKAKQAVSNFVSGAGEHKTSVDRDSRAAVTEEHVLPQQHNKVTTAIDKEVHQDHHRTVVQPIKHTETLPEKHTHNIIPVEHKTFEHDSAHDARATLDRDAAKYKDSSVTHETKHTSSAAPVVTGEHVHHHIHEHIQPVIEKQTVAPETVHTTVPIHETHHHPTVHHGTTTMPATTMQEFEKQHGSLTGSQGVATVKEFDGCAHDYLKGGETKTATGTSGLGAKGDAMAAAKVANDRNEQSKMFSGDRTAATGTTGTAATGTAATGMTGAAGATGASNYKTSSQTDPSMTTGTAVPRSTATDKTTTSTTTGTRTTAGTAAPVGTTATGRESVASGTSTASKPSLKDKLNPFKDADGDGKKGIMS